jgi:RNA recognition motif. (a.k.a. RRM, RBD, or RNP domain)
LQFLDLVELRTPICLFSLATLESTGYHFSSFSARGRRKRFSDFDSAPARPPSRTSLVRRFTLIFPESTLGSVRRTPLGKVYTMVNIYVGNLAWACTNEDLLKLFSGHGQVARAQIVMDRETGRSRGFGFVEMPNREEALAAIQALNETEMNGRPLTVNEAKPREPRPAGGANRGFGGGGGGYRGQQRY